MSSRFSLMPVAGALSIAAVVAAFAACAQTSSSDSSGGGDSAGGNDVDASPTNGAFSRGDASTEKSDVYRGNPLCGVPPMGKCMPDEVYSSYCGSAPAPDGGDASLEAPKVACRVTKSDASAPIPACEPVAGTGANGASCTTGADCAAGFDCVGGDTGSFCRQYCCLGTCGDPAASSSATFCDVQLLVDPNLVAPVCMPLKPCKLLTDGDCGRSETCAVVNENGDTGCVPVGTAQVGEACDIVHCERDLTCLGQPGNRKCQRLCKIGGDAVCTAPQTCTPTSAFKDSSYGICQAP